MSDTKVVLYDHHNFVTFDSKTGEKFIARLRVVALDRIYNSKERIVYRQAWGYEYDNYGGFGGYAGEFHDLPQRPAGTDDALMQTPGNLKDWR